MALADYKIFLDDERFPADSLSDAVIVRDFWEFKRVLADRGVPKYVAFDHDLGDPNYNGKKCAEQLIMMMYDLSPEDIAEFTFDVHSQNPVGAENIRSYLTQFLEEMTNV